MKKDEQHGKITWNAFMAKMHKRLGCQISKREEEDEASSFSSFPPSNPFLLLPTTPTIWQCSGWLAYCVIFPSVFLAFNCNLLAFRCLLPIHGWQQQKRKKNATSKAKTSKKAWRYKQNTFILSAFKLFSFIRFFFHFFSFHKGKIAQFSYFLPPTAPSPPCVISTRTQNKIPDPWHISCAVHHPPPHHEQLCTYVISPPSSGNSGERERVHIRAHIRTTLRFSFSRKCYAI